MPHRDEYIELKTMDEIDKSKKQRSLEDKYNVLKEIEQQLSDKSIEGHVRDTILEGKKTTEKAIELLKKPGITFEEYLKQMNLTGGSKKHRSKKHRSKKHRSKKHRSKKHKSRR